MTDNAILGSSLVLVGRLAKRKRTIISVEEFRKD